MANTLTAVIPKILARSLPVLRERCIMPSLVNSDYSMEARKKGATIDVEVPTAVGTRDVTPSNTPPASTDRTASTVQVPLNNWKQNDPFAMSDKELEEIMAREHFLPGTVDEAIRALANLVNADILDEYKGVYGFTGTAGTTPFASTAADATAARKILTNQLCPPTGRKVVLDADAEEAALNLGAFQDVDKAGSDVTKREGEIGRKFGMDWYFDHAVPTHTAGTATAMLINSAAVAVGDSSVAVDGDAGTMVRGDIFTVAGDTQTYVVTTGTTGAGTISFAPEAKVAWADNAAITIKGDHVVNLAFHRDAFAFATRRLDDSLMMTQGRQIMSMQDSQSGLILRLEVSRQHKQTVWEFDILWGCKLVRPELACRIAG